VLVNETELLFSWSSPFLTPTMSTTIATIADSTTGLNIDVTQGDDGSVTFVGGATLDGDGANGQAGHPPCYAPESYNGVTLDVIGNAGSPGNWWGIMTDNGQANGTPIVQGANDPAPGAFVSTTALNLPGPDGQELHDRSPFKYVDSATVAYISLPELVIDRASGVVMGCRCVVTNSENGASVEGVVADSGSEDHIGEISVASAKALGLPVGHTHEADGGGTTRPVIHYQFFPGTPALVNGVPYPLQAS
jgi:hypothetical protein